MPNGWKIIYDDGDEEDLWTHQVKEILLHKKTESKRVKPEKRNEPDYKTAVKNLCYRMGITKYEVIGTLETMEPPYNLNLAVSKIHKARDKGKYKEIPSETFKPQIGMKVRAIDGGVAWHGEVIGPPEKRDDGNGKLVQQWPVQWDEGAELYYMTFMELLKVDASRPVRSHPARGRELCALELFCGCGVVTQEFARLNFRVRSIDIATDSYATDKVDIMKLTYDNIGFVPDVIWASPPCQTYSNLAGGMHNKPSAEEYERTDTAREHAVWLTQLYAICRWAREHNPHLIVIVENPVGALKNMPLMQEIQSGLQLHTCAVDYCAFGRDDKKPTQLWTNDYDLYLTLNVRRCQNSCCPYKNTQHPIGARGNTHLFHSAGIPLALAEEVAEQCLAKFIRNRIRQTTPKIELTAEQIEDFNDRMTGKK